VDTVVQVGDKLRYIVYSFPTSLATQTLQLYSGTSLKGLSELRTQYKNLELPIKDKFCSPNDTMLIHFYLWKRKTSIYI